MSQGKTLVNLDEQYDQIELTEEESKEALRLAREKKYFYEKEIAYKKSLSKAYEPMKFTAEELLTFINVQYTIDDDNRSIVEQLCFYFSGDSRFSGDISKGIILFGGVGVGKTSLIRFFQRNQIFSFRLISCREIEQEYSTTGDQATEYYSTNITIANNSNPFGHQEIGFCFDDIGTESNGKYFGKEKNLIADILLNRYDNNLPKNSTHATTNLSAEEIKKNYGTRVFDRMIELMNPIYFHKDAKSRRK